MCALMARSRWCLRCECEARCLFWRFFEFEEDARCIVRVHEAHRIAVRTDFRLLVQHPNIPTACILHRCIDVAHIHTNVMYAAALILLEEVCDRRLVAERFQQLELRVGELDEDYALAVLLEDLNADVISGRQ